MLFNSLAFLIFLPIVLAIYYALPRRGQNVFLLLASYFFYGWWDWRFCSLLFISTIIDYFCGLAMENSEDPKHRKRVLTVSLCANLGILGFFKYFNFFTESAAELLGKLGMQASPFLLDIALPVGISFYTFQTLSYTLDIYRRQMKPTRDFLSFALFVSYFPQLVAGPIERALRLLPQIEAKRHVTGYHILSGFWLILLGYFKKVAIADAVAPFVNNVYNDPGSAGGAALLGATYLFALQIYGDFSGYSDIARGTSRLMGIELMVNFRQPYLAKNPSELWRRWHISLSSFLRDYLYIPLGGNRKGEGRTYVNLMTTMLLGGLWHGAAWTFVVWGGLHGLYLAAHRALTGSQPGSRRVNFALGHGLGERLLGVGKMLLMFNLVCLTWIFFRGNSLADSITITTHIFTDFLGGDMTNLFRFAIFGTLMLLLDVAQEGLRTDEPAPVFLPAPVAGVLAALLFAALFIFGGTGSAFIYFQF
jgi:D-alanyl-lipoteichoic acid acyltransferase DltB (MBOAT superfamily)